MKNKRVTSLYIRLNNNKLVEVKQDKFKEKIKWTTFKLE